MRCGYIALEEKQILGHEFRYYDSEDNGLVFRICIIRPIRLLQCALLTKPKRIRRERKCKLYGKFISLF